MASATQVQAQHGGTSQALLDAQVELWHQAFGYIKSMALKSALDLRIPDAIHHHGGTAMLAQIVTKVALHPSKTPCLLRLMRVLTVTGVFSVVKHRAGEHVYGLTPASRLLVGSRNVAPFLNLILDSVCVSPFLGLGAWFQREPPPDHQSLLEMTHGRTVWDQGDDDPTFGALFNEAMVSDSNFIMDIVIKECGDVFQGLSSVADVAGGLGGAAHAIANAFPHVKCSVLDLPNVVANAPESNNVEYVPGDMFQSIPPANAIFLKFVLHDWGEAECVKILQNCKKTIPPKDAGGKVIILDIVVGAGSLNLKHKETQVFFDLFIMLVSGAERDEQEWKKIIFEAGFSGYEILPVLGVRSIIVAYP